MQLLGTGLDRGLLLGDKLFLAAAAGTVGAEGLVAGTGPSDQLGMYCEAYYRRINGLRISRAISQMSFFTGMAGPDPVGMLTGIRRTPVGMLTDIRRRRGMTLNRAESPNN